jgi:hypothetical protein
MTILTIRDHDLDHNHNHDRATGQGKGKGMIRQAALGMANVLGRPTEEFSWFRHLDQ